MQTNFALSTVDTESESFFLTLFEERTRPELAEVTATVMDGWTLFACYLLSEDTTVYLGWEFGAPLAEWIDINESLQHQYFPYLQQALFQKFWTSHLHELCSSNAN